MVPPPTFILIGEMRVMCYSAKLLKPWSLKVCRVHILPSEARVRTIERLKNVSYQIISNVLRGVSRSN